MKWNKIFDQIRLWFGLPQVILSVINGKEFQKEVGSDTIAAVGGGTTWINRDYLDALEASGQKPDALFSNAVVHELGHVSKAYQMPGTFKNKVMHVKELAKLGIKGRAAHRLLNVAYDTDIDIESHDKGLYDAAPIISAFHIKDPESFQGSVVGEYLVAFREEAQGVTMAWFDIRDTVRETAKKVVAIVRQPLFVFQNGYSFMSTGEKVVEMSRILAELFKEDEPEPSDPKGEGGEGEESEGEGKPGKKTPKKGGKKPSKGEFTQEELDAIADAIEKAIEDGLLNEAKSAEEAEGDIDAALAEIDLKDKEEADIAKALLRLSESEFAFRMVWSDAEKSVRFDLQSTGMAEGEQIQACNQPWRVGEPIRNLDVASTMLQTGMFLPGVTTVQPMMMPGPGTPMPAPSFNSIMISADCSGSMETSSPYPGREGHNHDLVCAAIFAMIHEAKKKRIQVGVNLFGDVNKMLKPTCDYEQLARDVWSWVKRVGGDNLVSGTETLRNVVKPGTLVVYITDFHLYPEDCESARNDLHGFMSAGADVVFIAMFNRHNGAATGLEYAECKQLKDLQSITLRAARAKFQ